MAAAVVEAAAVAAAMNMARSEVGSARAQAWDLSETPFPSVSRAPPWGICTHMNSSAWTQGQKSFPGGSVVKNPPANAGDTRDTGSIPGSDKLPEVGNGTEKEMATHSSILAWRIRMDRGVWLATVHGVTNSWTQLRACAHAQWQALLLLK